MRKNKITRSLAKILAGGLRKTLTVEANTTSCVFVYQPKAPKNLADFRKRK